MTASAVPDLDPAQRRVVGHRHGPLLVLGAPGTGKTTALVESVVARIAEGADPERTVVFTFSRRGAARLRTRIATRVGGYRPVCGELPVRTLHGYAFAVLRRLAARRGEPPPRLLNGPEQDLVIRELLAGDGADVWPMPLRPALRTRGFTAELRDLLLRAVERDVSPARLAALGRELGRDDWVAAARFARQYADVLALRDATARGSTGYDTAELIRAASAQLAADPAALAAERRSCRYVYVDELHDLDPAQWELLHLVAGDGGTLVGFGDPDSSIFGFRGADPGGVLRMPDRFRSVAGSPAPIVTLGTCWRSGAALTSAARRVAGRLRGPARHRSRLENGRHDHRDAGSDAARSEPRDAGRYDDPGAGMETRLFPSAAQEVGYLVHQLRAAHLLGGVPWSAMAVLMRSASHQLAGLRRALTHAGVPVRVAAEDVPLASQPAIAPLLLLLRCALDPGRLDETAAVALLHSPFGGVDPFAERRLRQGLREQALAADDHRPSGDLLAEAVADPSRLAAVEDRWARPARRVAELLRVSRDAVSRPGVTAEEALWAVWQASGLAERWAAVSAEGGHHGAAADRDLDAVTALFDAAARFTDRLPGAGAETFVEHLVAQQIPADSLAPAAERGEAVELLTVHSAKGREWDLVAVPGVQEGRWPDLRLRGSVLGSELLVDAVAGRAAPGDRSGLVAAALDEERRLFYVAVTRARRRLIVSAVASGEGEEQPSRFLDELSPSTDNPQPVSSPDVSGPLTLPVLVAQLRTVAADRSADLASRRAAARQLARLAAAGVPGADPDEWWGLRPLSDDRPLAEPGQPVRVSPSVVEQVHRCGLRWLLERHGGARPPGPEQTVGSLVHAAAEHVEPTADALHRYLDEHWGVVEVAARWEAGRKREQAEHMVQRLVRWLRTNPRQLLAVERGFHVTVPGTDIEVAGVVDRLERDADGRLVVVDLKTGRSSPSAEEARRHPQLGTYQLAVRWGGFTDLSPVTEPGGAALVHLGKERRGGPEQRQDALGGDAEPGWAEDLVRDAAVAMSGRTVTAQVNRYCAVCSVQTSCPLSEHGRQVVEPPPGEVRP